MRGYVSATELATMAKCEKLVIAKNQVIDIRSAMKGTEIHADFDREFSKMIQPRKSRPYPKYCKSESFRKALFKIAFAIIFALIAYMTINSAIHGALNQIQANISQQHKP